MRTTTLLDPLSRTTTLVAVLLFLPVLATSHPLHAAPAPAPALVRRAAYAATANELVDGKTGCRAATVIYARGTTQDGNIGAAGDVGPDFFNNLTALVGAGSVAVQGVDYDASIPGFLGNLAGQDDPGVQTMADLVTRVSSYFLFSFPFFVLPPRIRRRGGEALRKTAQRYYGRRDLRR